MKITTTNTANDELLYTFDEVQAILKTSKQTLRKMLKSGEISSFKLGKYNYRIPSSSLQAYLTKKMGR